MLRVAAAPSELTLSLDATDLSSEEKRSTETLIYSQSWDRFDLAGARSSLRGMRWWIEPATKKELAAVQGRSGYHIRITLPPEMPDGRFTAAIDFSAKPPLAAELPRTVQVQLQGSIDGRLSIYGSKLDANQVLRLGVLEEGESVQENLVMKVRDERPSLVIERIENATKVFACAGCALRGRVGETGAIPDYGRNSPCPTLQFRRPKFRPDSAENRSPQVAGDRS